MEVVDTSGDLELALKLDQEERKFLEQSRNDEAFARELQARMGREVSEDEEEEEEEAEGGGEEPEAEDEEEILQRQQEEQAEMERRRRARRERQENGDDDDDEEDDEEASDDEGIVLGEPRIRRHPQGEAGPSLEMLLQQLGLRLDPRRVHFAGLDNVIGDFERAQGTDPFILEQLPTRKYVKPQSANGLQSCSICLADFENDDEVTSLPCFHWFHKPEITQWLAVNNSCPICKTIVAF